MFLSPSAQVGGAERVLFDMIASLRARDARLRIVVIVSGDGPLLSLLRELDAKVIVLPFPSALASLGDASAAMGGTLSGTLFRSLFSVPGVMRYAWLLRKTLRREAPDVVHSNGAKMHLLAAVSGHRVAPVVWHLHDYVSPRPVMRRLLSATVTRCAAIVANSESVASDARRVFGSKVRVTVMLNGVDLDRFAPNGPLLDLDALAGNAPPRDAVVRVGLVATFARWKGHDLFFRALAALPTDSTVRGYVIGGPFYETRGSQCTLEELRNKADTLGISDRVVFTGPVDDVPAALRALDVVVHASTEPEPFGLVIAEAMACGRAVLTCGSGGALELVDSERTAVVAPRNDAAAAGAAIDRLARNPELRATLGAAARTSAVTHFDRRDCATTLMLLYNTIASVRG